MGLKHRAEITDVYLRIDVVGERCMGDEGVPEGALERIQVKMHGISNDKGSENLPRRKPKVSRVKLVFPGLAGT